MHHVEQIQCLYCSLKLLFPVTLLLDYSVSVLPFTCGDVTWFWLRQYVARCKIKFPSLPLSYKWSCDHPGQWSESGSLGEGVLKQFFKWDSIPRVYNFCSSTSSCLKCWMWRIQPVNMRQQLCIWNLHHGLLGRKLEGACITDGITGSPIPVLRSLTLGILFHGKKKNL